MDMLHQVDIYVHELTFAVGHSLAQTFSRGHLTEKARVYERALPLWGICRELIVTGLLFYPNS
jgi:hypothetical protein